MNRKCYTYWELYFHCNTFFITFWQCVKSWSVLFFHTKINTIYLQQPMWFVSIRIINLSGMILFSLVYLDSVHRSDSYGINSIEVIELSAWKYGLRVNAIIFFFHKFCQKQKFINNQTNQLIKFGGNKMFVILMKTASASRYLLKYDWFDAV